MTAARSTRFRRFRFPPRRTWEESPQSRWREGDHSGFGGVVSRLTLVSIADFRRDIVVAQTFEVGAGQRGFVRGFGLRAGALGSSVGHYCHNLCVIGADDADMAVAANRLIALGGGFVAVRGGTVVAELALPVAGLVSLRSFEDVADDLERPRAAGREILPFDLRLHPLRWRT